jgi:hypothetical protein
VRKLPFRTFDYPGEVHPGLRAYPFLAQVCCHPRCCGCGLALPAAVPCLPARHAEPCTGPCSLPMQLQCCKSGMQEEAWL